MVPKCCGRAMKVTLETSRFYELYCDSCRDTVYMKKEEIEISPVLLDD